jgi:glycosyltransferase involved in cell wall biosynthesis
MSDFCRARENCRVFEISGEGNAAVARNVVLDNARSGFVMLLDGDTLLAPGFLDVGVERVLRGDADAVIGSMDDLRHDSENKPESRHVRRGGVSVERYVIINEGCNGSILLGPAASDSGERYDELLRRGQDRDFVLRLSSRFRVLEVTDLLGIHLTHHYYSRARVRQFYRQAYPRPIGFLLRKNIVKPRRLAKLIWLERGPVLGLAYQVLLLLGLATSTWWLVAGVLAALTLEFARFCIQRRPGEFIPIRVVSPWLIAYGLLGPREPRPVYSVRQIC